VVPPTEPCALRSTQPLKVSTRHFFWGKGGRYVCLTTYHPCSAETSRKSGALTHPEPLGPPRPVAGDLYFTLLTNYIPYMSQYELLRDFKALNTLRELLVIIRIWGLLRQSCLPVFVRSAENLDVLALLFRLLSRLIQTSEPDENLLGNNVCTF